MLLNTEQLRAWSGYERAADIARWLKENGIAYTLGKGGEVCTTLECVTTGLQGGSSSGKKARFTHGAQAA